MTEKVKRHIRMGWDISKPVMTVGSILLLMHQAVDLRGKVVSQQADQQTTASALVASMKDVARLSGQVKDLKGRVTRLEQPLRIARAGPLHGTAAPDTVAARSPGLLEATGSLLVAPLKFGWGVLKSLVPGG